MRFHGFLSDSKAEARAPATLGKEGLKDFCQILILNTWTEIINDTIDPLLITFGSQGGFNSYPTIRWRVLNRILDKVNENCGEPAPINHNSGQCFVDVVNKRHLGNLCRRQAGSN